MNTAILYSEKQKFKQWWIWLIVVFINVLYIYAVYRQILLGEPFGNKPMSNQWLLVFSIVPILLFILFLISKLEMQIKPDGIYVRFFPFHLKYRVLLWQDISRAYIRKYSALLEYGGWGIRYGLFGKGMCYNVSGNMGLQIEFKNNKKILIGTHHPEEINKVLPKQ